ncbi:uncharacterized protein BCR38DRAFT_481484 [Pseudomassariella vexata]|uniref:Uncharacterized protein n=1 Tax=Pseudomassariella vexata TaxID=1141098 RepID=A0A1Y2EFJ9_9PEZI|nr:uncharacterized protein BCR38DRAFT_481484 [Pseudomassariella vexata]ORY70352.1 hypothetical protein BCR38DRAFT_481484 [Pseudomassariella vexata]
MKENTTPADTALHDNGGQKTPKKATKDMTTKPEESKLEKISKEKLPKEKVPEEKTHAETQKKKPEPLSIKMHVPWSVRLDPFVRPDDAKYVEMKRYFTKLVRNPGTTMDQILNQHFTPHEINKFVPTNEGNFAKLQKNNTEDFQYLLNSTFKNEKPTLETKLVMMYFGLPVAPMKMLGIDIANSDDLDDLEEPRPIIRNQLDFLDDWSQRTYGEDPYHVDRSKTRLLMSKPLKPLGLRGGGLDEDEMQDIWSDDDEYSAVCESQANQQLALCRGGDAQPSKVVVYGRQGSMAVDATWGQGGIAPAIVELLSLRSNEHIDICIDLFDGDNCLQFFKGIFLQPWDQYAKSKENTITSFFTDKVLSLSHPACFVRLAADEAPPALEPGLGSGVAKLVLETRNRPAITAYLRTPTTPTVSNTSSQYVVEYQRSLGVFFSNNMEGEKVRHQYLRMRTLPEEKRISGKETDEKVYTCQDITESVVQQIATQAATGNVPSIELKPEDINTNKIPIITPDDQGWVSETQAVTKTQLWETDWICRATQDAWASKLTGASKVTSIEFWVPAEDFHNLDVSPIIVSLTTNGDPTAAGHGAWIDRINAFKAEDPEHYNKGFAVVARPVYNSYRLQAPAWETVKGHSAYHDFKLMEQDLELFKDQISIYLFQNGYDKFEQTHVLRLQPEGGISGHVVRHDTTEDEWKRIQRRIITDRINVEASIAPHEASLGARAEKDTKWDVNPLSYWGPCYDVEVGPDIPMPDALLEERAARQARGQEVQEIHDALGKNFRYQQMGEDHTTASIKATHDMSDEGRQNSHEEINVSAARNGNRKTSDEKGQKIREDMAAASKTRLKNDSDKTRKEEIARLLNRGTHNLRGAIDHVSMRAQAFWDPPSVYANPLKPAMPIHGPPMESVIKTGPSVPEVSLAMRTPTEMARLQREVHMLRGQILDRVRECPYQGCDKYLAYSDALEMDRHLNQDHYILKCFFCCPKTDHRLQYFNEEQIKAHIATEHYEELKQLGQVPVDTGGESLQEGSLALTENCDRDAMVAIETKKKVLFSFCDRCGRDQNLCRQEGDYINHKLKCKMFEFSPDDVRYGERPAYCATCGYKLGCSLGNRQCTRVGCLTYGPNPQEENNFCKECGYGIRHLTEKDRIQHLLGCRPCGGWTWDYCGFCGVQLAHLGDAKKCEHGWWCDARPRPKPVRCPSEMCQSVILTSPEQAIAHFNFEHNVHHSCLWCGKNWSKNRSEEWIDDKKLRHFAQHMHQFAPLFIEVEGDQSPMGDRCPYYEQCGSITTNMKESQYLAHMKQHGVDEDGVRNPDLDVYSRTDHIFYPTGVPNRRFNDPPISMFGFREAEEGDIVEARRPASPNWAQMGPESDSFMPEPHWSCSRCFRPAGKDPEEIARHSDPHLSCKIRRAKGYIGSPRLVPNRSGWINFDEVDIDPAKCRDDFIKKYPAYLYTMFPANPRNVIKVYGDKPNRGEDRDDPNFDEEGVVLDHIQSGSWYLPWPPYEGRVIPMTVPEGFDPRANQLALQRSSQSDKGELKIEHKSPETRPSPVKVQRKRKIQYDSESSLEAVKKPKNVANKRKRPLMLDDTDFLSDVTSIDSDGKPRMKRRKAYVDSDGEWHPSETESDSDSQPDLKIVSTENEISAGEESETDVEDSSKTKKGKRTKKITRRQKPLKVLNDDPDDPGYSREKALRPDPFEFANKVPLELNMPDIDDNDILPSHKMPKSVKHPRLTSTLPNRSTAARRSLAAVKKVPAGTKVSAAKKIPEARRAVAVKKASGTKRTAVAAATRKNKEDFHCEGPANTETTPANTTGTMTSRTIKKVGAKLTPVSKKDEVEAGPIAPETPLAARELSKASAPATAPAPGQASSSAAAAALPNTPGVNPALELKASTGSAPMQKAVAGMAPDTPPTSRRPSVMTSTLDQEPIDATITSA